MRTVTSVLLAAVLVAPLAAPMARASNIVVPVAPATSDVSSQQKSKKANSADKAAPKAAAADEPAPTRAAPKSKLPPDDRLYVDAGYADWFVNGNQTKFREYATPPTGFFLRDLRYAPEVGAADDIFLRLQGIGGEDYRGSGKATWNYGATQLSGFVTRSVFFDPTPQTIDSSRRNIGELNFHQALTRGFGLNLQYRSDDERKVFAAPFLPLDQRVEYWGADSGGRLGSGTVKLYVSNLHFEDHTGKYVNSNTQTLGANYQYSPTKAIDTAADVSHTKIVEPGQPDSHVDVMSLAGDFGIGSSTDLGFQLLRRQLTLPTVQNAYSKDENVAAVLLAQRWESWRAQFDVKLQDADRVNGNQTFIDVPKWTTFDARVSGRLGKRIRLTVRGYNQYLHDPPASELEDPDTLYFTSRSNVQARLEAASKDVVGYLVWNYLDQRNGTRDTVETSNQFTLGGTWQVNQSVNVFAELHHESWSGHTVSVGFPTLSNFLPDSNSGVIEVTWAPNPRTYFSANYTGFATFNDNPLMEQDGNTRGQYFTLSGRYKFPAGYEVGLTVAPWHYDDNAVSALNYNATLFMVTGSAKF